MHKKAFTLVEILIVIIIIGILATLAVPQYNKMIWKVRWVQALITLKAIHRAELQYYMENNHFQRTGNIMGGSGDYAANVAELNAYLHNNGIEPVEISDKAFEHFNYDIATTQWSSGNKAMAIRKDAPNPDPKYDMGRWGIAVDLLTGEAEYNSTCYP